MQKRPSYSPLGEYLENIPLADYTTWRVGGKAKALYKPVNIQDLAAFLKELPASQPIHWLGLGSNSLFRDKGFAGTVILTQGCLKNIDLISQDIVRAEAGVSCASMARFCARNNLAKAEFLAGIPGTVGGALRMNAGCYDGETWNYVSEVETITRNGQIHKRTPDSFTVSYRNVIGLEEDEWFIAASFRLPKGEKAISLNTIKELLERRKNTQPTNEYNCGSVFRNPKGNYAAALIEQCGLKGYRIGGAMVSLKHANFIINENKSASATDIESLITFIQNTVREKTNISLVREVHIIGEA
ncbi:MAG: UDP-N-acetylenolpyruvoylglucosamine reductase [Legionellales bacterium RIFCSPHIGHO2_12_FULL_37_14]|nr:MAG: UDP-N-acetylenolpyruvoylglucosamine reductase [Legionellales bacterium RIFCSPHIGHO2_12_FULL_37_14]